MKNRFTANRQRQLINVPAFSSVPNSIFVIGGAGPYAPWQAGVYCAMAEHLTPVYISGASAGSVLTVLLGLKYSTNYIRDLYINHFNSTVLATIGQLNFFERKGLDLAGVLTTRGIQTVIKSATDNLSSFEPFRYKPGDVKPNGVEHSVGLTVCSWTKNKPADRRYTPEELSDPLFTRRLFRSCLLDLSEPPFRKFKQVEIPSLLSSVFPEFSDDRTLNDPTTIAAISSSQLFATVPWVKQNPDTLQLTFFIDGAHADNLPSIFNNGLDPGFPLIAVRLADRRDYSRADISRIKSGKWMPYGMVLYADRRHLPKLKLTSIVSGKGLGPRECERMFDDGYNFGASRAPLLAESIHWWYEIRKADIAERMQRQFAKHGMAELNAEARPLAVMKPWRHLFSLFLADQGKPAPEIAPLGHARVIETGSHISYAQWGPGSTY